MESQPQNPEFRNNPENFHPCIWKEKQDNYLLCSMYINPMPGPIIQQFRIGTLDG